MKNFSVEFLVNVSDSADSASANGFLFKVFPKDCMNAAVEARENNAM